MRFVILIFSIFFSIQSFANNYCRGGQWVFTTPLCNYASDCQLDYTIGPSDQCADSQKDCIVLVPSQCKRDCSISFEVATLGQQKKASDQKKRGKYFKLPGSIDKFVLWNNRHIKSYYSTLTCKLSKRKVVPRRDSDVRRIRPHSGGLER